MAEKKITSVTFPELELVLANAVARKTANQYNNFASQDQWFLDLTGNAALNTDMLKVYDGNNAEKFVGPSKGYVDAALSTCAKKGQTLINSGGSLFVNGEVTLPASSFSDGLYWFVYSGSQAFVVITADLLTASSTAPIRVAMPVIYDSSGSMRMGTLKIRKVSDNVIIRVSVDNDIYAHSSLRLMVYKTNLV